MLAVLAADAGRDGVPDRRATTRAAHEYLTIGMKR
jgi:hypothetical protein